MKLGKLEMWVQQNENVPFCIDLDNSDYKPYRGDVRLEFKVKDRSGYPYNVSVGYEMRKAVVPFVCNKDDPTRYGRVNNSSLGLILHDDPIYNLMEALDLPTQKVVATLYSRDNIVDPQ